MTRTTMNMTEQLPLWYDEVSFGYMPNSGIARDWGRLIAIFLRNCHTDFYSGCTTLPPSNGGVFQIVEDF